MRPRQQTKSKRQWYQGRIRRREKELQNSGSKLCENVVVIEMVTENQISTRKARRCRAACLPPLLPGESLVEKRKDLGDVELDILQIQVILVVLLHFQKVIELEVELKEAPVSPLVM